MTATTAACTSDRPGPRILIVDDNQDMVSSLCDVVHLRGWMSDGAPTGADAVRMFEQGGYDAVLMDIRMPGINGVDAFRLMRRARPEVPVILMTGYADQRLIEQARSDGVADVLAKPVAIETLFRLLAQIKTS